MLPLKRPCSFSRSRIVIVNAKFGVYIMYVYVSRDRFQISQYPTKELTSMNKQHVTQYCKSCMLVRFHLARWLGERSAAIYYLKDVFSSRNLCSFSYTLLQTTAIKIFRGNLFALNTLSFSLGRIIKAVHFDGVYLKDNLRQF